ncbi:hypothetical protein VW29_02945 [Devosia limi DSM 17137]|uniref:Uncharacterized protein n=1 Tax=Devosia limi DSM 17137 TaxID=1121477 RepID=A0A0F5LVX0_9HYPH|nr:hypothetical protein [Devosia limi]KKB86319.1 hypothetical protein VW29_02945 [Devosia limi DSM 17137]SHF73571.1 hypothetical protein SAMN02745223_03439 [Devosia limi DSM 17137]
MKLLLAMTTTLLTLVTPALAFEAPVQGVIEGYKASKPMRIADVGTLMRHSERWCYLEDAGSCAWWDVYLEVSDTGASFEIGNAWDEAVDIAFVDRGDFRDGRFICETGADWVPSVRATRRADGSMIGGRELAALKAEIAGPQSAEVLNCFDYLYMGSDDPEKTVTLLQRQYVDDVHQAGRDTLVTLHFDPESAAALTSRW